MSMTELIITLIDSLPHKNKEKFLEELLKKF